MEQIYTSINTSTEAFFRGGLLNFLITVFFMWLSTWVLRLVIRKVLNRFLVKNKLNESNFAFIHKILNTIIYTLLGFGISIQIIPLSELTLSVLASSGVMVLIIGFAAQEAFSNIISGFFISFFRPFSVGHLVTLASEKITGTVEDITLRHTVIRTIENNRIIVPNSIINKAIIENRDIIDKTACRAFTISIAYNSDLDKAKQIMIEEALKNPLLIDQRTKKEIKEEIPQVKVIVSNLSESSVELRMSVWAKTSGDAFNLLAELRENIKKRFDSEGIEIPYPYQNIIIKK
jgi:small conductance mechanosensitive channel